MDRRQRRLLGRQQSGAQRRLALASAPDRRTAAPTAATRDAVIGDALKLARLQRTDGQLDEAWKVYQGILEIQPAQPDALLGLAQVAQQAGDLDAACSLLERSVAVHPGHGPLHVEYGTVLRSLHRLEDAIVAYRRAAALLPDQPSSWNNLGTVLFEHLELDGARAAYERAIALAPEYARGHYGLGTVLLMQGELARGLAEHEWRWQLPGYTSEGEAFFRTFWDGDDLAGRTILVHDEQGFGDTIQHVRFLPQVKALGGRVILRCPPALGRLLAEIDGADQVLSIARGEPLPGFDVHAPLMSLPHLLGTTLETIPANVPYLRPSPDDVARWAARMAPDLGFKVGLVWAGSPLHPNDSRRSLSLDALGGLAQPGVSFYSLQKEAASAAAATPPAGTRVIDLGPDLHDFAETAAAISQLDLVITVDTAVGHLAGALGRPVWLLLSSVHDTRWMTVREDTPWYPMTRLFRQQRGDDWSRVLDRVRAELRTAALRA